MEQHVLDNPAWNALISGNKHLARGNNHVGYFDAEVSPFVAFEDHSVACFEELCTHIVHQNPVIYISLCEIEIPEIWKVVRIIRGFQMVCDVEREPTVPAVNLQPLVGRNVPQMLALTRLTNPGPFAERTIEFGHYEGIFDGDTLAAMAGQRLHAFNYAEISAVCTHPDYLGRGYARQLLHYQVQRIKDAGGIPYLHVRHDNDRAVKVYEDLGFYTRTGVYFYVLAKSEV